MLYRVRIKPFNTDSALVAVRVNTFTNNPPRVFSRAELHFDVKMPAAHSSSIKRDTGNFPAPIVPVDTTQYSEQFVSHNEYLQLIRRCVSYDSTRLQYVSLPRSDTGGTVVRAD